MDAYQRYSHKIPELDVLDVPRSLAVNDGNDDEENEDHEEDEEEREEPRHDDEEEEEEPVWTAIDDAHRCRRRGRARPH